MHVPSYVACGLCAVLGIKLAKLTPLKSMFEEKSKQLLQWAFKSDMNKKLILGLITQDYHLASLDEEEETSGDVSFSLDAIFSSVSAVSSLSSFFNLFTTFNDFVNMPPCLSIDMLRVEFNHFDETRLIYTGSWSKDFVFTDEIVIQFILFCPVNGVVTTNKCLFHSSQRCLASSRTSVIIDTLDYKVAIQVVMTILCLFITTFIDCSRCCLLQGCCLCFHTFTITTYRTSLFERTCTVLVLLLSQFFFVLFEAASFSTIALLSLVNFIFKIKNIKLITKSIAPIGLMFTCLAIVTGAIWGQPTWGTW